MKNLFLIATKKGYRFSDGVNTYTVEDLWKLPINSTRSFDSTLAKIAGKLNDRLKEITAELPWLEFEGVTDEQEEIQNKLDLVREIVECIREDIAAVKEREQNEVLREQILAEQERRKYSVLKEKTDEELEEMAKSLG